MAQKLTYMWNIVAKLAKLQKSILSRVDPNSRVKFQMDESSKFFDTFFGEPHITLSPIS